VRDAGAAGLTGRRASEALDGNVTKETMDALLERLGLVNQHTVPAGPRGGRPTRLLVPTYAA